MNGADILLYAEVSNVQTVIGSQRGVTFDETSAEIDVSSKTTRSGRYIGGRYGATVTLDALYVPSDTAYQALKAAVRSGDPITIRRFEEGVATEEADAIVTSVSETGPDQEAATVSIALRIDGDWTEVTT